MKFIEEINQSNSTNYKLDVLKKYHKDELIKRVLKMTYDRVTFTYGIGKTTLNKYKIKEHKGIIPLEVALDFLEKELSTRNLTGNIAVEELFKILEQLSESNSTLVKHILERDLRINIGKTQINKVFKDLIVKPCYMRCDVFSKKTLNNIQYKAILQKKSDGTFREFSVEDGEVTCRSRSGESYDYFVLNEDLAKLPDGIYVGELTVKASVKTLKHIQDKIDFLSKKGEDVTELVSIMESATNSLINDLEYIFPRAIGNGMLNSDNPPHNEVILELWDYIMFQEYANARLRIKNSTPYEVRFNTLINNIHSKFDNLRVIEHKIVESLEEAFEQNKLWMEKGYEGSILKNLKAIFKDGTSGEQLKIKLKISSEMRIIGFQEGTIGTKREGKVGSLIFANDEGTIKGSCSGFTDKELDEFTLNKVHYLDKIIEVEFNDITRAEGNNFYALSHPRFIEIRNDKNETDTLEKVFKMKEMAMDVSKSL